MNYSLDYIIVYLCNNIFCLFCISRIFREYSKKKVIIWREVLGFILYFFVLSLSYLLNHNVGINLFVNVGSLFLLSLLYLNTVRLRLMVIAVIYFAMITSEAIAISLLRLNPENRAEITEEQLEIVCVIECIILSLFVHALKKYKSMKSNNDIPWYIWGNVVMVQIGLALLAVFLPGNMDRNLTTIFVLFIAFTNFSCLYLVDQLLSHEARKRMYAIMEEQNKSFSREIDILLDSQKRIRKMSHDIKNHFLILKNYLDEERYDDLRQYFERMEKVTGSMVSVVYTGNRMVDAILNYKIGAMNKENIKIDVQTKTSKQLQVDDFDVAIMLGNILDNAIEACLQLDEGREIFLSISEVKNQLFITVRNTFGGKIVWKDGLPVTGKKDKFLHGLGLSNVTSIVEKYNGTMSLTEDAGKFVVKLMIYLS